MKRVGLSLMLCLAAGPVLGADFSLRCDLGDPAGNNYAIYGTNTGPRPLRCAAGCTATAADGRQSHLTCTFNLEIGAQDKWVCGDAGQNGWPPPFSNPALDYSTSDPCQ